jgi:hypothetical protein
VRGPNPADGKRYNTPSPSRGGDGSASFIAHGLPNLVVVTPGSVWKDHPGYDRNRRPLQCVQCDHVFKRRGDLIEDMGDLICKGRTSCRKRQQGENV